MSASVSATIIGASNASGCTVWAIAGKDSAAARATMPAECCKVGIFTPFEPVLLLCFATLTHYALPIEAGATAPKPYDMYV